MKGLFLAIRRLFARPTPTPPPFFPAPANTVVGFAHGLVRENDEKRPGYDAVKAWIGGAA